MPERRLMRPVYVCQMEERKQMEVRRLLEGLILHGCGGDKSEVERYYGMSFEEAVQNDMNSKIVDLDYLMVFYAEEYNFREQRAKWACLHAHLATAARAGQSTVSCGLSGPEKRMKSSVWRMPP